MDFSTPESHCSHSVEDGCHCGERVVILDDPSTDNSEKRQNSSSKRRLSDPCSSSLKRRCCHSRTRSVCVSPQDSLLSLQIPSSPTGLLSYSQLSPYIADKRNVILESINSVVPHIVITPAEEDWSDYYALWHNHVDFQQAGLLSVPQTSWGSCCLPQPSNQEAERCDSYVSSPSVIAGALSRLPLVQTGASTLRELYQLSALLACKVGAECKEAYETCHDIYESLEKVFRWTDPAEPLLQEARWQKGVILDESANPFRLPHIKIDTPPPQHPFEVWNNSLPLIQDHQNGNALVVLSSSPKVEYINIDFSSVDSGFARILESRGYEIRYEEPADVIQLPDCFVESVDQIPCFFSESDSDEIPSPPETPSPPTPSDDFAEDFPFPSVQDALWYQPNDCDAAMDGFYPHNEKLLHAPIDYEMGKPLAEAFRIDEDEDELPSLDDWLR